SMVQVQPIRSAVGPNVTLATSPAAAGLDDAAVRSLLRAEDADSIAQLSEWLKGHAKAIAGIATEAIQEENGLSPQAARAVLDAIGRRGPSSGETTLLLLNACLDVIAQRTSDSLASGGPCSLSDGDDALVGSAVALLTSSRPAKHSETAISRLAQAGPGGALILARAFDAVRGALKLHIVRHLRPADVLELGGNVVVSLGQSVAKLAEGLQRPERGVADRFLAGLGPVQGSEPSEVGANDPLEVGDRIFHASWGTGVVTTANDETATIDFGGAGTRTLLRAVATLRRAH
ncbi:MAG: hypothetical protein HY876_09710, partial [Coriobacteriales bacterium]|nr:hypothetical protein [Coriobacteriales bacterium]